MQVSAEAPNLCDKQGTTGREDATPDDVHPSHHIRTGPLQLAQPGSATASDGDGKFKDTQMTLFKITALCSVFALSAAGPLAALEKTLSGVEVKSDLSSYEDNNVLKFWPSMDEDLATAISSKLNIDEKADAPRISVEINKVSIDGDTVLPDSGEFNTLEGTVTTHEGGNETASTSQDETEDAIIGSYPLRMTAISGEHDLPDDWVTVAPSQDDFYNALIDAYATSIVERIEE